MANPLKEIPSILTVTPRYVLAPDHKFVYINGSRMGISPWDFRIICSLAKDNEGEGLHEDQVTLAMSPQHAKVMMNNWIKTVKLYEDMFGPIPDIGSTIAAARAKNKEAEAKESKKGPPQRKIRIKKTG